MTLNHFLLAVETTTYISKKLVVHVNYFPYQSIGRQRNRKRVNLSFMFKFNNLNPI